MADYYGSAAKERLKQFRTGEVGELLDLFEDNKRELSKVARSIDAAGPDDDILEIEIRTFGSVYWIEAIEHDDIGYFASSVDAVVHALIEFEPRITELRERERTTPPMQDEVVMAVLSKARNGRRLATQFTEAVGYPMEPLDEKNGGFDEIASGGFVSHKDVKGLYKQPVDFWSFEGTVSKSRMKAFEEGAAPTSAERARHIKHILARYFAEPTDGWLYVIVAVPSSSGRRAYWTELREGDAFSGVERVVLGIFPSMTAAKAALRRKGLISVRDYRPRHQARRT